MRAVSVVDRVEYGVGDELIPTLSTIDPIPTSQSRYPMIDVFVDGRWVVGGGWTVVALDVDASFPAKSLPRV